NGTGQTTGEQKRTHTLSNGEVIWDLAGNVWEWTDATVSNGRQPGAAGVVAREWNSGISAGGLSINPFPAYANPQAIGWTSANGLGQVSSNSDEQNVRAFLRGAAFYNHALAGVYGLSFSLAPGSPGDRFGFRATYY
ncbi:hypothetical protein B7Y94_03150, partial [Candidatus Saccharibacteria bacterium 32-49-12]